MIRARFAGARRVLAGLVLLVSCSGPMEQNPPHYDAGAECFSNDDCDPSQKCDLGRCVCDPDVCPGRCSSTEVDRCIAKDCSVNEHNGCGPGGFDMCDPAADQCYPSNGDCESSRDCATFGDVNRGLGTLSCDVEHGKCHIAPLDATSIEDLSEIDSLDLRGIPSSAWFPDASAVRFTWDAIEGPMVVTVSVTEPVHRVDLDSAYWSAFLDAGETEVHWSSGATRVDGKWKKPPAPPPTGVPLYAVGAAYSGAKLVSVSRVSSFRVGSEWPKVGSSCGGDGGTADCTSPLQPLRCLDRTCRLLCASHRDCLGEPGQRCELPDADGIRVCVYPRRSTSLDAGLAADGGLR